MSIRKQYDSDLEALKTALVEMGQNAAEAVENALEALCTADTAAAQKIVQGDDRINNMERDIEHRCMTLLLRQQPVAGDLRHISTAMKVVTDIERMGDHASDIAEIIPHLVTVRKERDPAVSQAIAMGRKAYQMILDAMDALTAEDEIAARRVIAADDAVDYDFNAIKHAGTGNRRRPRQGGRGAGSAHGHQVSGAHRRPRRECSRVGAVRAHRALQGRKYVLILPLPLWARVFLIFF